MPKKTRTKKEEKEIATVDDHHLGDGGRKRMLMVPARASEEEELPLSVVVSLKAPPPLTWCWEGLALSQNDWRPPPALPSR